MYHKRIYTIHIARLTKRVRTADRVQRDRVGYIVSQSAVRTIVERRTVCMYNLVVCVCILYTCDFDSPAFRVYASTVFGSFSLQKPSLITKPRIEVIQIILRLFITCEPVLLLKYCRFPSS